MAETTNDSANSGTQALSLRIQGGRNMKKKIATLLTTVVMVSALFAGPALARDRNDSNQGRWRGGDEGASIIPIRRIPCIRSINARGRKICTLQRGKPVNGAIATPTTLGAGGGPIATAGGVLTATTATRRNLLAALSRDS